jgi:hypothetical protein
VQRVVHHRGVQMAAGAGVHLLHAQPVRRMRSASISVS